MFETIMDAEAGHKIYFFIIKNLDCPATSYLVIHEFKKNQFKYSVYNYYMCIETRFYIKKIHLSFSSLRTLHGIYYNF